MKTSRRQFLATTGSALAAAALTPPFALTAAADRTWRVAVIGHTKRGDYGHGLDVMWQRIPETFSADVRLDKARRDTWGTLTNVEEVTRNAHASDAVGLDFPSSFGFGVSWRPRDTLTLSADLTRKSWSVARASTTSTSWRPGGAWTGSRRFRPRRSSIRSCSTRASAAFPTPTTRATPSGSWASRTRSRSASASSGSSSPAA